MRRLVRPGFVPRQKEPRFFAGRIDHEDWAWLEGDRVEVLLLDEAGQVGGLVLLNENEVTSPPAEAEVPEPLLRFAMGQPEGGGDFVDAQGDTLMQNRDKQAPSPLRGYVSGLGGTALGGAGYYFLKRMQEEDTLFGWKDAAFVLLGLAGGFVLWAAQRIRVKIPPPPWSMPAVRPPRYRKQGLSQVVNRPCAACGQRIEVAVGASECSLCGRPLHHACLPPDRSTVLPGKCLKCGITG
jgi:hypothetical protein